MRNADELSRWLRDAEACLKTARRDMEADDFRATVQNGQLVVEFSTKAVIACFGEPEWTHDPSGQLLNTIKVNQKGIKEGFGDEMIAQLRILAKDAEEISPWHGWASYGKKGNDGSWTPAVDLCTKAKVTRALKLAERSFKTANIFVNKWFDQNL